MRVEGRGTPARAARADAAAICLSTSPGAMLAPVWIGPTLTAAAYLSGSVCFGLLAAKRAGVDLRAIGSGNVGATNVGRALGGRTARIVLFLDAAKGALPVGASVWLLGRLDPFTAGAALAAVVGHCYPLYFGFRGGKGVATAAGVVAVLQPIALGAGLAAFLILRQVSGKTSVGSLGGVLVALGTVGAVDRLTPPTYAVAAIVALVIWRHRENLRRLKKGEELDAP